MVGVADNDSRLAEGSFRRKTPRLTKPTPGRTYDGY